MAVRLIAILCFFALSSCSYVGIQSRSLLPPYESEATYEQIELGESTSSDVLAAIARPDELLSQSKSVVASQGMKKKGHKLWLTMVAFDEDEPTVKRKYFFVVDDKAESIPFVSRRRLDFDIEMLLDAKTLSEPYANENARRIAIFKQVIENSRGDIAEVAPDNKMIVICGGLINQTFETILYRLEESPVLASKLSGNKVLGFDHITIGKGTIRMNITGDIVDVKVRSGGFVWSGEDPFSLEE